MANGVNGHIFDYVKTTSKEFSKIINELSNQKSHVLKNYGNQFSATVSGLKVTIASGWAIIQGRIVYINDTVSLTVPANYTGYLVLEVDLSKINTVTGAPTEESYAVVNNQVSLKLVTSLVTGNLLTTSTLSQFPLYSVSSTGTTATLAKIIESFRDFYTATVNFGYGVTATLTRVGSTVTVYVGSNQTTARGDAYTTLEEMLPLGYRPVFETMMSFDVAIGNSFEYDRSRKQKLFQNGSMATFTKNMNAAPLALSGTITYQTDDPFPV